MDRKAKKLMKIRSDVQRCVQELQHIEVSGCQKPLVPRPWGGQGLGFPLCSIHSIEGSLLRHEIPHQTFL